MKRYVYHIVILFLCISCVSCSTQKTFKREKSPLFEGVYKDRDYIGDEQYIDIDGVSVCYVDNGRQGVPVLIFLHGLSLSIHNFRYNYPYFCDDYRVIAVDFPGFGKSDMPDHSYDISYFTSFVMRFMDVLGIDRASFIGNSLGSHVALQIGFEYPDKVDVLVIESATGIRQRYGFLEDMMLDMYISENRFLHQSERKMREHIEWSWNKIVPAADELVRHRVLYRRQYYGTERYFENNRAFVKGLNHVIKDSIRNKVHTVSVPTLIVWGEKDKVTHPNDARFLHAQIQGSELAFIPDAGHLAHIEEPEAFNRLVSQYLKRHLLLQGGNE
ncbi:MAG: alpha/beta hydrolase [Candidatus Auribacter fodinae]|jgi:2-hydroxy-6-oxonona-2,4-dienedioate hydrolase|uniref:Alpha/beta hydrolase n=1 Tax=Candidatus Auribacter fodinae TaxID=2093366 RepID=A0A3A4R773_9BACT|nr:MAG: alpha/beta hydrolase [Candidatus Auribacter fodinae]